MNDYYYRLLVENAEEYAIFAMDRDGQIISWNEGAERLLGWTEEEAIGQSCAIIFTEDDHEAGIPEQERSIAAREGHADDTRWHVKKDGTHFWTDAAMEAIENEAGEVVGFAKIIHDLTERKHYEETLEESNRRLETFARHIAHELRSPLVGMNLFFRELLNEYKDHFDEETTEMVRLSQETFDYLIEFADELLSYARLGTTKLDFEPIDTREIVQSAISDLKTTIDQTGAEVEVDTLPDVVANGTRLRELFRNLIENAIKYNEAEAPHVRIEAEEQDHTWRFTVRDNGVGIAPDDQEIIFKPFERIGDGGESGTGLGLALCKEIVELHGGQIGTESEPGMGSAFHFTLPKNPEVAERQASNGTVGKRELQS